MAETTTRGVGQTFASFSLQVKWLIIASELQESEAKLKRTAEIIRVLSSQIVNMVQKVIAGATEEDVPVHVIRCCERVSATAESLVVASQMFDISGTSGFSRNGSLIGQAIVLHEATVELLRLASDVEAASVIRCSRNINPALNSLLSARDLNHLEELVMSYSEVVSGFENDVSKRNILLCESVDFQAVNQSIDALKKSIPLMSASMKTILMYPEIEDAQISKNNVVGLVLSSLDSLSDTLRKKNQSWPLTDSSLKFRQFSAVCKALVGDLKKKMATTNSMSSVDLTDLDIQLNHIVQYAMDFAALAGNESKTNIFKTCIMLMENHERISQQSQSSSYSVLHDGKCFVSVSAELNRSLIGCLDQLQAKVVDTLPYVVTSIIIKNHVKPVFNLLKAVKERSHSNESLLEAEEPVKSWGSKVQFCADQFRDELKDFCTCMRSAVAGSTASATDVEDMQKHICAVEKLGNKILMAAEELSHDDHIDSYESESHIVASLEANVNEWCIEAEKLLVNADKLVTAEVLLMLCGERIWKTVSSHSHSSVSKDNALNESVILMTQRFLRLSAKVNDKHLDAWLKNGLRRKIAALERVLSELKSTDGLERRSGTEPDSARFYRSLQQSISDICWCVKTRQLTDDRHEEPLSVVRVAFDCLIDNALTESNSTGFMDCEVEFDLLTSLGLHGSTMCEIKEIMDCLIFDAVSGAAEEEIRSRRLLFTSNHILHSVLLVLGSIEQKDRKRSFIFNKLAQLTDLVPMILDEADNVRCFKQSDLQSLYELAEKLCHTMSLLIDFVDDVLLRWNPIPQNVIMYAMAVIERPLLTKETEELNCLMAAVLDLISLAKEEAVDFEDEDFRTLTKTDSLKEFIEEIESLSYKVLSSTRKMNSNDWSAVKSDFVRELRILLRDWSTRVYFLTTRLGRLSVRYLDGDYTWKERLLWMREENDRLTNEMRYVSDEENEIVQLLDDLSYICDQMDDIVKLSDHLFSTQKLAMLSAQWNSKVRRLENRRKDRISTSGSGRQSSTMDKSSSSFANKEMEETQSDSKKRSTDHDGPVATEAIPRITGDENTFKQTKQKDWYEKFISDRSAADTLPTSDKKISRAAQSPINKSPKTVKKQVSPVQQTRRFFGYKIDDRVPATSGSIVDCIHDMSKAAYQLKEHLQNQRESFENKRESKDRVTELLVTIRKKEEKVVQVANVLINHCNDDRIGDDVRFALQHVQSILSQLYILISVKMAVDDTHTEDKNLKTSIQRLLDSLNNLKCGFEAVCVKGLTQSSGESSADDREVEAMARWWKIKWIQSQSLNSLRADKDELGLRASKNYLPPQPL